MKKLISVLLAGVMLVMSIGFVPVFAAEPVTLHSDNFDASAVGAKPTGLRLAENATKKIFPRIAEEDGNRYLRIYAEPDGVGGPPRADFLFELNTIDDMTVTLKAKGDGANPNLQFVADGTIIGLGTIEASKWADVRVELDFKKKTSVMYVNGKATKEKELNIADGAEKGEIRFCGTLEPGQAVCFDDILITTSAVHEVKKDETPDVDATKIPFEPKSVPTKPAVPSGAYAFLDTDFTGVKEGDVTKTGLFHTATPYLSVLTIDDNALMRAWATDGKNHATRTQVQLPAEVDTYVIDFAFMASEDTAVSLSVYEGNSGKATIFTSTKAETLRYDDWNYLHAEVDLASQTASFVLNGKQTGTASIKEIEDRENNVHLRLIASIDPGKIAYFDAMQVYTMEEYTFDGILLGNQQVMWENVKPTEPISEKSYVNNLKSHPRLLVHDWDVMREKINQTAETRQWYQSIKAYADACLTDNMAQYAINSRGNILESAREAQGRLMCLSFMYKITGEQKYFDRAVAEAKEYGTWPDWSGFVSNLVTAELVYGYACMYDWLYDDLSAEQKQMLIDSEKKLGLPAFIYDYENKTGVAARTNNWNPVCNGAMLGAAFAFADEEENLSEYIFERAPEFIIKSLHAYAPQGATDEGVSYWDYGTTYLCMIMDMFDNSFAAGFALPEKYKYYTYPGISETGDFPIYYSSSVGKFDYGDAGMGTGGTASEALYWLANKFNKPQYAWMSNKTQLENGSYIQPDTGSYIMAYGPIFALSVYDPNNASVAPGTFTLDRFYDSTEGTGGMSMRSSWDSANELFAAMEGGYTTVDHMFYSLGTYVIDWDGVRFIDEDMAGNYALKESKEKIYYKRAEAHNTLIINPSAAPEQTPGAGAFVERSGSSDNTAFGIMNMTQTSADYASAMRGMMMTDNRRRVILRDEVQAKKPSEFYWFANTQANIKISEDGRSVLLERDGARMLLRMLEAPADARFGVMERKSLIDGVLNTQTGYKLYVHMENVQNLNFAVEYVGLKDGEGIPAPWQAEPLAAWSADDNGLSTVASAGSAVVLKLDTPNAIAKGEKTYVDTANYDVVPFTENGRTLVPVRFISESFGAKVGWDDATQSVTVDYGDKNITLQIGSNLMYVNGEAVTLDVPANTYNSRTLIPLRALVEALGKYVHWDDRGLIIIADDATPYPADVVDRFIKELNVRVTINGQDMTFFELDRVNYVLNIKNGEAVPQIGVSTIGTEQVSAIQANAIGETATVTIDDKVYNIRIENDLFEYVKTGKDPGMIHGITVARTGIALPERDTFIPVEDLVDSTGFATYPKRGIVDGVINTQTANRWACDGEGWIQMDFGAVKNVHSMGFAGVTQDKRAYNFDVEASIDGVTWTKIHEGGAPTTSDWMSILPLGNAQARYIKLVCKGNNQNTWNTYAEVRFYESEAQQKEDISYWNTYFGTVGASGKVGETMQLTVKGLDAKNTEFALRPDAKITYKVADASVATVSPDGKITYLKAGKTTVHVRAEQDGYSATATVEVVVE